MSIWQGSNMIAGSGGGGIANYDGKSITENSMEEIQTVGVINSRDTSTAVKTWTGTKAQYDAIVTKDQNTLYNITDDTTSGTDIYSKTEVDSLLDTKANVNLSNMNPTQTVKNTIVGWGMPDYDNIEDITFPFTPTKNGILMVLDNHTANQENNVLINGVQIIYDYTGNGIARSTYHIPVSIGDSVTSTLNNWQVRRFIPLKGVN